MTYIPEAFTHGGAHLEGKYVDDAILFPSHYLVDHTRYGGKCSSMMIPQQLFFALLRVMVYRDQT